MVGGTSANNGTKKIGRRTASVHKKSSYSELPKKGGKEGVENTGNSVKIIGIVSQGNPAIGGGVTATVQGMIFPLIIKQTKD